MTSQPRQYSSHATTTTTALPQNILPLRQIIYESLIKYYGDLTFAKVPTGKENSISMYATRIFSMCAESRYLFAVCPADNMPLGFQCKLSQLRWVSFQARVTETVYNAPQNGYVPTDTLFTDAAIKQISEDSVATTYQVEGFPVHVQLLGNKGFRNSGTVGDALETFATVMFFG